MIYDRGSIIQVKNIKIGDELIDTSEEKEIRWIERRSDILEIYVYNKNDDRFESIPYEVEYYKPVIISGGNSDIENN